MEEKKTDLSIIIVAHNSKDDLQSLLPSVWESERIVFAGKGLQPFQNQGGLETRPYAAEIIIVDNGSDDGTVESLQELISRSADKPISYISNTNTGFAAGNNLGIKRASGKYILLLNPDTRLRPDTLSKMVAFMDSRPDVGISGCKIVKPDGKLDLACRRRFPNPWNSFKRLFLLDNRGYNYSDIDENQSMEVDSVVGAFMMIRKYRKIGISENRKFDLSDSSDFSDFPKLDEDFFMYGEDLDLCWRCKAAGYKVWYYPAASIVHYKGSSSRQTPFAALKWFHNAMWIFYQKHYARRYIFLFNGLVWLGIKFRFFALIAINFFRQEKFVSKR